MALASYTPPLTSQSTIGTCSYGGWVRPVNGVRGVGAVGPASHSCRLLRLLQLRNSRPLSGALRAGVGAGIIN
jgi:hypothetical protein